MTSNIGSEWLTADATADGEIKPDARERVMAEMRTHFRPEFLNRLDDIVSVQAAHPARDRAHR